jgi:transposase
VDIGKFVFQVHCQDAEGNTLMRQKMSRSQLLDYFVSAEPCEVAMEACAGSHFLARRLKEYGHTPRLIAPQFVRPFLKSCKTDANDAEAICEAASRPSMRFVSAKTESQQILSDCSESDSPWLPSVAARQTKFRLFSSNSALPCREGPAFGQGWPT